MNTEPKTNLVYDLLEQIFTSFKTFNESIDLKSELQLISSTWYDILRRGNEYTGNWLFIYFQHVKSHEMEKPTINDSHVCVFEGMKKLASRLYYSSQLTTEQNANKTVHINHLRTKSNVITHKSISIGMQHIDWASFAHAVDARLLCIVHYRYISSTTPLKMYGLRWPKQTGMLMCVRSALVRESL